MAKKQHFRLVIGLLSILCCLGNLLIKAEAAVAKSDAEALQEFEAGIHSDPGGALDSWRSDQVCAWKGVQCSRIRSSPGEFRVTGLNLSGSLLEGTISPKLARLSHLKELDLSRNRLSGRIPKELASLSKLRSINLSHNQLLGPIPHSLSTRVFSRAASFEGNPGLCGRPLQSKCPSNFFAGIASAVKMQIKGPYQKKSQILRRSLADSPAESPRGASPGPASSPTSPAPSPAARIEHKKRRSKLQRWGIGAAFGVLAGSVAGIIVGVIGRLGLIWYKKSRNKTGPVIFYHKIQTKMLAFLDNPECFQQMDVLGAGAAGKIYKATLENGMTVAIKRIPINNQESSGQDSESSGKPSFGRRHTMAEMDTLGKIRHNNLAWLYAYIPKPDAHLLLFKFMPGGSLLDALAKVRVGGAILDWKARRKIAIGTVKGLKYLHFDCTPKILHRDLKTSNILLDEDLEAHLGDFGLAKAIPDGMTHVTTMAAGTVGYMPPEYAQTMKLTAASDIYSLGIVLGALICGKEPTDEKFMAIPMVTWMCFLVQSGQELEGIDPVLINPPPEVEARVEAGGSSVRAEDIAEMKLVLRIACLCTKPVPADRPSAKDVLVMLNPTKLESFRPMTELIQET